MPFKQVVFTSSWLEFYNVSSTSSSRTFWSKPPPLRRPHTHIKQQHELTAPWWRVRFHWEPSTLTPTTAHKHTPLWHGLSATTSNSNKVLGLAAASSRPGRKWCQLGSRPNSGSSPRALLWSGVKCCWGWGKQVCCFGQAEQVQRCGIRVGRFDKWSRDQRWAQSVASGSSLVDCLKNPRTISVFQSKFQ